MCLCGVVVCGVVGCCVVDFIATVYLGKLEFRQSKLGLLALPPTSLRLFPWCGVVQFPICHFFVSCFFTWLRGPVCVGEWDVQVQLDGSIRRSGVGVPPWDRWLDDIPTLDSVQTRLTDGISSSG